MPQPLVSAIMPTRNAELTIADAIRSVRWQTHTDWELVVVDDGSTDATHRVALEAAGGDPRIRVIAAPAMGRGGARNRCLQFCGGLFVAICDSDDVSLPDRFATQVRLLEGPPQADVVSCARVISFTPDLTQGFAALAPSTHAEIVDALARGRMPILFASAMVRRELFERNGGFDPELHRNQDLGFFLQVGGTARFATVPTSLILYRSPGRVATWGLVSENNFYRRLARLRHLGRSISAARYRRSAEGIAYRYGIVPLQYAWHVVKRLLLGAGLARLTTAERELLDRTLSALNTDAGIEGRERGPRS